jgi:L-asparaginase
VKKICIIALGGTIASLPSSGASGALPELTADALVEAIPVLADLADITPVTYAKKASVDLQLSDIWGLVAFAEKEVAAGADGIVITQGTDTLEETSFAFDLLWTHPQPVVFTAAMRIASAPGADGPANVVAAVRVATSPDTIGAGCIVVINDEIHTPRFVKKSHTSNVGTFASHPFGPLGIITESHVQMPFSVSSLTRLPVPEGRSARVRLVTATLGGDDAMFHDLLSDDIDGVVFAGFGGGHSRGALAPILKAVAATKPVALASRVHGGSVLSETYGFEGSETDLLRGGLLHCGLLSAVKARILLSTLLTGLKGNPDPQTVAAAFTAYVAALSRP